MSLSEIGQLRRIVLGHRARGCRIVLTNGCFDILHLGHLRYLRQARALGDVLIVGVNSDDSVRRLKGDGRPLNTAHDRAELVAGLSCVDLVVVFNELTPRRLIETVRPDVYVKGGDYALDRLPERQLVERLGGRVEIVTHLPGRSTTGIVARLTGMST
jgi:rfaE bifunctional protein nucleotidyltransferase chain/domain